MKLANTGKKFRGRHKIVGGSHFYGQVLDIPDTSRVSNFLTARRYLRVYPNCLVKPKDLVDISKEEYIVAEHGTGFFKTPIYRHYKLFFVDDKLDWVHYTQTTNPVTGVKESDVEASMGLIPISIQPKSLINDQFKIQTPQHTLLTNANISVGDKIGPLWIATKVDHVLGIYLVEVKEA